MSFFLFSLDLYVGFVLASIFLFLIPFILIIKKNRIMINIYFITYLLILSLGVFGYIKLSYTNISFNILITKEWFNNPLTIATFEPLGILINLFLLFPLGIIIPSLSKSKLNLYKVILMGFFTSFSIELLQFSLPILRYPELLDIINNTISVILGYLYYLLILNWQERRVSHDQLSKQENH